MGLNLGISENVRIDVELPRLNINAAATLHNQTGNSTAGIDDGDVFIELAEARLAEGIAFDATLNSLIIPLEATVTDIVGILDLANVLSVPKQTPGQSATIMIGGNRKAVEAAQSGNCPEGYVVGRRANGDSGCSRDATTLSTAKSACDQNPSCLI